MVDDVSTLPGRLQRSDIAKLLIGSLSECIGDFGDHELFGHLANTPHFRLMNEINQMLAEDVLRMDDDRLVIRRSDKHRVHRSQQPTC
jgi:hypothetical protein